MNWFKKNLKVKLIFASGLIIAFFVGLSIGRYEFLYSSFWIGYPDIRITRKLYPYIGHISTNGGKARIKQINIFEIDNNYLSSTECDDVNVDIIKTLISPSQLSEEFFNSMSDAEILTNCDEYKVSENFSIIDIRYYSKSAIIIKDLMKNTNSDSDQQNWAYNKIIENITDYPGWNYNLKGVDNEGNIYFSYGGWRYIGVGGGKTGDKNFKIYFEE